MAAGADDILARAQIVDSLTEAVSDCSRVVATSARRRSIPWPSQSPRVCVAEMTRAAREGPVAFVFGRESSGLSNSELELCNSVVQIPTNSEFRSLNIASAVQIICYEMMLACDGHTDNPTDDGEQAAPADHNQMQQFYQHLQQCMTDVGFFDPAKPRRLMRRMKRLFNRAQPDVNEMNILRGFLASIQDGIKKGMTGKS